MSGLPSGTITFLFTDIDGSTRQWEQMPEQMAVALAKHDEILQRAIEGHGGHVFKTVGDAFCAAFPNAADAVQASLEIHRRLSGHDFAPIQLKVRMAMHSGTAEQRGEDYFGPTLNRTARILAVGHGSQILLSEVCQSLVRESLPAGGSLTSLGVHRLKDLGLPETIYQLGHPDLPSDFPPLKSLGTRSSSLPQYLSRFIGRERELDLVRSLAAESRLATLTGSGGCGKTRLATQVAAEIADSFPDGVWFFEFAPLSDPSAIPSTIAETLSVKAAPSEGPLKAVQTAIGEQSMLLIFDNCEHVLDEASSTVAALLKSCPRIHVLATSREALGIDGERTYRVPSLQTPNPEETDASALRQCESVQLFVDRARLTSPDFEVDDAKAKPLASICSRLDGIPLAIELAASRARMMSVEQIEQNLDQRFRLLTGGSRSALPRQQTLRSLIDWSHALLSDREKALFRRLSAFAGSWTLEAAESVCAGPDLESWEVMDLLASLIDKSLVNRIEGTSPDRYRFLETIRQYARDQLLASSDGMEIRQRHLEYFTNLAVAMHSNTIVNMHAKVVRRFGEDQENFEAAQEFADGQQQYAGLALFLANVVSMYWWQIGRLHYGLHHLESALHLNPEASRERALSFLQAGRIRSSLGEYEAAKAMATEARLVFAELGDMEGVCYAMNLLANSLNSLGEPGSKELLEEALGITKRQGFERLEGVLSTNIALRAYHRGDLEAALPCFQRAYELAQNADDPVRLSVCLNNLAEATFFGGDIERAKALFSSAIEVQMQERLLGSSAYAFEGIAQIGFVADQFAESVQLCARARAMRERGGSTNTPEERRVVDALLDKLRDKLTAEEFDAAWHAGKQMTVEDGWTLSRQILSTP